MVNGASIAPVEAVEADRSMMPYPAGPGWQAAKGVRTHPSSVLAFATPAVRAGPDAGAGPLVPALVHAGVVILRSSPTGGGITAMLVVAVADGRHLPCCTQPKSCCCNPPSPVARTRPPVATLIHSGVVIRLPRPTSGRAPIGSIATIAGTLPPSCRAPTDSCRCSPLGA